MLKRIILSCLFLTYLWNTVFAFSPNSILVNLPDHTALDLGPYTCISPEGDPMECGSITDYSGFIYDKHRHQMLMFGGGHSATFRDDIDTFNSVTLTWGSAYAPTPCKEMTTENLDSDKGAWITTNHPFSRHTYDLLVFADNTKHFLMLSSGGGKSYCDRASTWYPAGKVAHYNPDSQSWSYGASMRKTWSSYGAAEYDPLSGRVVIVDEHSLWTYDPVKRVAKKQLNYTKPIDMGYANNLVYYPPNGKMYYIARGNPTRVFEVRLNRRKWSRSTVTEVTGMAGNIPNSQESGWAYDATNQIIGGGVRDGRFYAYSPRTNIWTSHVIQTDPPGSSVGTLAFHALDYDPVNNVFIFITDRDSGRRTWAYRYAKDPSPSSPDTTLPHVQIGTQ